MLSVTRLLRRFNPNNANHELCHHTDDVTRAGFQPQQLQHRESQNEGVALSCDNL
jgi:hypothetical protein